MDKASAAPNLFLMLGWVLPGNAKIPVLREFPLILVASLHVLTSGGDSTGEGSEKAPLKKNAFSAEVRPEPFEMGKLSVHPEWSMIKRSIISPPVVPWNG